jgi:hypothetical protein
MLRHSTLLDVLILKFLGGWRSATGLSALVLPECGVHAKRYSEK